ncbi:MAG: hypothetical protein KatS3mg076_0736 [Candidatus Binatia bacterium]|nr:MAG: hypothetical protein KatS3mg076_0736 [Candidatus Binatia bacterium]
MKRWTAGAGVAVLGFLWGAAALAGEIAPRVTAKAGILVERGRNRVLWERAADLPLPPASTTKVLTALVTLRYGDTDALLPVSRKAASAAPTKLYLRPGWQVRTSDLLYALLLTSANDAAEVLAEGVAGSVERFAELMNREARKAGATRSHFVNPHGLPAPGHRATARDLVRILDEALKEPFFLEIAASKTGLVRPVRAGRRAFHLRNRNRLLYEKGPLVLGKTGWTRAAKKCFVGAAFLEDGRILLVSILGSQDLWGDVKRLLAFGASVRFEAEPIVEVAAKADDPSELAEGDGTPESAIEGSTYTIEVASFADLRRAERWRRTLRKSGLPVILRRVDREGRRIYELHTEPIEGREEAERTARELRRYHGLRPIVRRKS